MAAITQHDGQDVLSLAWYGAVRAFAVSWLQSTVRPLSPMVRGVRGGPAVRSTKVAIAEALRTDGAVAALVPAAHVFAVERATVPSLPSIEVIAVTSERVGDGPMVRHELQIEVTVSHQSEDGADLALDDIVRAVRARLAASERTVDPIDLASGEGALCVLGATRWSISASSTSSVIRGAAVSLSVQVSE